jgi:predicted ferric reductase
MMNRKTAEKIAAIVLLGVLCIIFVIENAHALSATCHGYTDNSIDNGKCVRLEKTPYYFGYYDGKQAGQIAFFQVDDSCDSTASAHTDQCIKGHTDAYNGEKETR